MCCVLRVVSVWAGGWWWKGCGQWSELPSLYPSQEPEPGPGKHLESSPPGLAWHHSLHTSHISSRAQATLATLSHSPTHITFLLSVGKRARANITRLKVESIGPNPSIGIRSSCSQNKKIQIFLFWFDLIGLGLNFSLVTRASGLSIEINPQNKTSKRKGDCLTQNLCLNLQF